MPNANKKIEIIIEGRPQDGGDASLDIFLSQLISFKDALRILDNEISGGNTIHFRVVDLSHSSPATLSLEAYPNDNNQVDHTEDVIGCLFGLLLGIKSGEYPPNINMEVLEKLREITNRTLANLKKTIIKIRGEVIEFDKEFSDNIEKLFAPAGECFSTYEGEIKLLDIHGQENVFNIYPYSGPKQIKCYFPDNLYDDVLRGMQHKESSPKVMVSGVAKYKGNNDFPHEIKVDKIKIYPPDDKLPSFSQIKGVAPNLTGDKSSEEYISELRDAWE